tara:strand:+ start:22308 stop:23003 length:696 start_codon:yes stop_codon:yes gene_type:complete
MSTVTYKKRNVDLLSNLLPNITNEKLDQYAAYFSEKTSQIKYQKRGVMPLEMFTIYVFCKELNIDTLLESGTARGYSIELLASVMPDIKMITAENFERKYNYEVPTKERLSHLKNITFVNGDGTNILPNVATSLPEASIGAFIDGPKDEAAIVLANKMMQFKNVNFVSCHDLHSGLNYCPYNDIEFRQKYEYLNNEVYSLPIEGAGGMSSTFEGETIKDRWPNGYGITLSI